MCRSKPRLRQQWTLWIILPFPSINNGYQLYTEAINGILVKEQSFLLCVRIEIMQPGMNLLPLNNQATSSQGPLPDETSMSLSCSAFRNANSFKRPSSWKEDTNPRQQRRLETPLPLTVK